jgi:phytoene dehydrogenase-like protein
VRYDAIVIGGGHNGLVCASYLAGAGLKVRVLERRHLVGGAAVTEEFAPGFRNSTAAYTVSLLNPKVIRDLRLAEHGLKIVERPFANFLPLPGGKYFKLGPTTADTQKELARFSQRDAERLPEYYRVIETAADTLRSLVLETPPNLGMSWRSGLRALALGGKLALLSRRAQRDLWEIVTKSAGELLDWWFESDPLKAAFGFDAQVGHFASPYSPGSAYVLLHHAFGEVNGKRGTWGHALGGMGAVSDAIATEAKARGVEITTNAEVTAIRVKAGRAASVALEDGTEIEADAIAGAVNPKLLYLKMLEPGALDPEFRSRIERWRCASGSFRMNVALSELPDFTSAPGKHAQPHHSAGIIIGPSLAYMERAYFDARTHGWAREPIVEMLIPSTVDPDLAPQGKHVASLFCQHFDPVLPDGGNWDDAKEAAADTVIETVNRHAPNFKASIIARKSSHPSTSSATSA